MAGTSLLALIDDIASILDDVSVMTKVAAKKTSGVLGDDLALNAQQVTGVNADRELPVVWAVAKGSLVNKAILVPAALLISSFLPWLVTPLLMLGGAFLCYEGFEKLVHSLGQGHDADHAEEKAGPVDAVAREQWEKTKIKGAIRTDFVLSAEIITISLGVVAEHPLTTQIVVLCLIALIMTVGVYGFVAALVKIDDLGLYLLKRPSVLAKQIGRGLLALMPWLMKGLSVLGTAAMFMVGGSIVAHGIHLLGEGIAHLSDMAGGVVGVGGMLKFLVSILLELGLGVVVGALALALVSLLTGLWRKLKPST